MAVKLVMTMYILLEEIETFGMYVAWLNVESRVQNEDELHNYFNNNGSPGSFINTKIRD